MGTNFLAKLRCFGLFGEASTYSTWVLQRALTYKIAKAKTRKTKAELVFSGTLASLFIPLFMTCICLILLYFSQNFGFGSLNLFGLSKVEVLVAILSLFPTVALSGVRGILEGLNRFQYANLNRSIIGMSMYALPLPFVYFESSNLFPFILSNLVVRLALLVVNLLALRARLRPPLYSVLREKIKDLISVGKWIFAAGLLVPIIMYLDRFLIDISFSSETSTFYGLAQEGVIRLLIFPGAFASALFFKFTSDTSSLLELRSQTARLMLKQTVVFGIFFAFLHRMCPTIPEHLVGSRSRGGCWPSC